MTTRSIQQTNARRSASYALGFLIAACGAEVVSAQAGSAEAAGVEAAETPQLSWIACPLAPQFECASATVPRDYANPNGPKIELALTRLPAADPSRRIGSLFVNPGGPGVSGVSDVQDEAQTRYSDEIRAHFDIVGFDPRFTAASQRAQCVTREQNSELFGPAFRDVPITEAQESVVQQNYARYAQSCAERMPEMQYASTANVARDLELLRRAVGDERLSYAGYSYGTVLGQTYAALYPNKVRAILLDGVADAEAWSGTAATLSRPFWSRTGAAVATEEALQEFFRLCRDAGLERCPLARYGDPEVVFTQLANALRMGPIPKLDPLYDYSWLIRNTQGTLNVPSTWNMFSYVLARFWTYVFVPNTSIDSEAIEQVEQERRAILESDPWYGAHRVLLDDPQSDFVDERAAKYAVACADTLNPRTPEAWSRAAAEEEVRAPHFGKFWIFDGLPCASWSLPTPGRYTGPYHLPTSAPVLVANPRFDAATSLAAARAVASKLPGARLLILDAVSHTTGHHRSSCMDSAVTRYFVEGVLPAAETVCATETGYFAEPVMDNTPWPEAPAQQP